MKQKLFHANQPSPRYRCPMLSTPTCLYITNLERTGEARLRQVVTEGCAAGVDGILLREATLNSGKLLALASMLRVITHKHHASLIIHSQADIAQAVQADGIHLAAANIHEATAIRQWLRGTPMTLSTSCHNSAELQASLDASVDFTLLSPVFPSASHLGTPALGIKAFKQLAANHPIETVALGGITSQNRSQLAGYPIATMRAIDEAEDIAQAVALLIDQQTTMAQQ